MAWHRASGAIPIERGEFQRIVSGLVFCCPSSVVHRIRMKSDSGKRRYERRFEPVSNRGCSFRKRDITGSLLTTLLAEIRRPLQAKGGYSKLSSGCGRTVQEEFSALDQSPGHSDGSFDLMVYRERSDMSDVEAIYYYIRNAFAHGSFNVVLEPKPIYYLEASRKGTITSRMRLREQTLLRVLDLGELSPNEIKALRKGGTKRGVH